MRVDCDEILMLVELGMEVDSGEFSLSKVSFDDGLESFPLMNPKSIWKHEPSLCSTKSEVELLLFMDFVRL